MNVGRRWPLPAAGFMVALLLLSAWARPALGGTQGRITGRVTDAKGNPVEGVKITITTDALSNYKVELQSKKDGRYETILNDSTLTYNYLFEKQGYVPTKRDKFKVGVASTGVLDIELLTPDQAIEKGVVKTVEDPFTKAFNDAVDKFKKDDLDGAIVDAAKAIELGPDKSLSWSMGAKVAAKKKDWDKTIEWGEKALAMDADNTDLYGPLMDAYRGKGNKAKIAEYEKKFAAANPDKPEILYNQAVEFYNKGDARAAEPILRKVLEANPEYANAHYLIGMCYVNLGKVPDLKKHFHEYLRLDPKGKEAGTAKDMLEAFK